MDDKPKQPRSLSEISHLFLSGVRQRQTQGAPPPLRKPPPPDPRLSIDLTPEEFAQTLGDSTARRSIEAPPVKALLASHMGARHLECARQYARNLAASGKRVGLIVIDVAEFQLITFDPAAGSEAQSGPPSTCLDARAIRDAINELNCDLDCWLLSVANPRVAEARALLRNVGHWILLSTPDHDGIVCAYRTLKGLADLGRRRLSVAAVDAREPAQAQRVFQKLSSVCAQFISWTVEPEPPIGSDLQVGECQVMCCRTEHDKAQLASAAHWQIVAELVNEAASHAEEEPPAPIDAAPPAPAAAEAGPAQSPQPHETIADAMPATRPFASVGPQDEGPAPAPFRPAPLMPEVVDLADGNSEESIVSAVLRHSVNEVIECPIRPPMCPQARLGVSRERRIILIAVAGHGLGALKAIGQAYRWVNENRALLAMALPQFALDAHQLPHLRLLVDHADVNAEVLAPMFQVSTVSIHTYRRVRWGQRTGLLLDAA